MIKESPNHNPDVDANTDNRVKRVAKKAGATVLLAGLATGIAAASVVAYRGLEDNPAPATPTPTTAEAEPDLSTTSTTVGLTDPESESPGATVAGGEHGPTAVRLTPEDPNGSETPTDPNEVNAPTSN